MKRKLMIVIEDNGQDGGKGFDVYLAGDKDRIGKIPEEQLGPAEFWGAKLFQICGKIVSDTGAAKRKYPKGSN